METQVVAAEWGKLEHLVETGEQGSVAHDRFSPEVLLVEGLVSDTLIRLACGWGGAALLGTLPLPILSGTPAIGGPVYIPSIWLPVYKGCKG